MGLGYTDAVDGCHVVQQFVAECLFFNLLDFVVCKAKSLRRLKIETDLHKEPRIRKAHPKHIRFRLSLQHSRECVDRERDICGLFVGFGYKLTYINRTIIGGYDKEKRVVSDDAVLVDRAG